MYMYIGTRVDGRVEKSNAQLVTKHPARMAQSGDFELTTTSALLHSQGTREVKRSSEPGGCLRTSDQGRPVRSPHLDLKVGRISHLTPNDKATVPETHLVVLALMRISIRDGLPVKPGDLVSIDFLDVALQVRGTSRTVERAPLFDDEFLACCLSRGYGGGHPGVVVAVVEVSTGSEMCGTEDVLVVIMDRDHVNSRTRATDEVRLIAEGRRSAAREDELSSMARTVSISHNTMVTRRLTWFLFPTLFLIC